MKHRKVWQLLLTILLMGVEKKELLCLTQT